MRKIHIIIPGVFLVFILLSVLVSKITIGEFDKFPLITKKQSINSEVLISSEFKGITQIISLDSTRFSVRAYSINNKKEPMHFDIESRDSLSKNIGSDTIYLHKRESKQVIAYLIYD